MITEFREQSESDSLVPGEDIDENQMWLRTGVLMTLGSSAELLGDDFILCVPAL
jgi:hypothetical protein